MNDIEKEIEHLRYELSVTIPEEIQLALEAGDWGDNSEFSEIISRQYYTGIRLKQLIDRLNAHKLIDLKNISKNAVGMGSLVTVHNKESKKDITYKIISVELSDVDSGDYEEVTLNSPLGKALNNKQIGDDVVVYLPSGKVSLKIVKLLTIHEL
jgi:transcription elongation factor GreA